MTLYDYDQGVEQWNEYIDPLRTTIKQIRSEQIKMRDALKGGVALAVGWKAQGKLLCGLGNFFQITKIKAIKFVKKNPSVKPQHYMQTPEGALFRVVGDVQNKKTSSIKTKISSVVNTKNQLKN